MDCLKIQSYIDQQFEEQVLPTLMKFIEIPNLSPCFDKEWETNGFLDQVIQVFIDWAYSQQIQNLSHWILRDKGRTPILFFEVQGSSAGTILLYSHMDKQPHMTEGWSQGLHPLKPVIRDNKLYGRGSSDCGYAFFSNLLAVKACQYFNIPHGKVILCIESGEESGSKDFISFLPQIQEKVQNVDLVAIVDSRCLTYDRFWIVDSLRGNLNFKIKVQIAQSSAHSGEAGGIVPSTWRILQILLSKIYDPQTGSIKIQKANIEIPQYIQENALKVGKLLGSKIYEHYQFVNEAKPESEDLAQLLLNNTLKPCLEIIGINNLPLCQNAGNVLRSQTEAVVSIRLPPNVDSQEVYSEIQNILLTDVPFQADVQLSNASFLDGYLAPELPKWLSNAIQESSVALFGNESLKRGSGGSIGTVKPISLAFPEAIIMPIGVLGPGTNAHCPDECLDIPYCKKFVNLIAHLIKNNAQKE